MADLTVLRQAEQARAKSFVKWSGGLHLLTLVATLIALFASAPVAYGLAVLALAFEILAWGLRSYGLDRNDLAEEAGRRAMIADGLGLSASAQTEIGLLVNRFSSQSRTAAQTPRSRPYFDSQAPQGLDRLRESLQQSAFYSSFLYRKAAHRALLRFALLSVGIIISSILSLAYVPHTAALSAARVIVVLLSALLARDLLGQGLSWLRGAGIAERTVERLGRVGEADLDSIIAAATDYAAATATRPPISDALYESHQDQLDKDWARRSNDSGGTTEETLSIPN